MELAENTPTTKLNHCNKPAAKDIVTRFSLH